VAAAPPVDGVVSIEGIATNEGLEGSAEQKSVRATAVSSGRVLRVSDLEPAKLGSELDAGQRAVEKADMSGTVLGPGSMPGPEGLAKAAGARGVIIDRCNFNIDQRSRWLQLAAEVASLTGVQTITVCVVLPRATDAKFCIRRATARGNDGLHAGTENWKHIVRSMAAQFQAPTGLGKEGFDAVYWCDHSGAGDISEICELLADAA